MSRLGVFGSLAPVTSDPWLLTRTSQGAKRQPEPRQAEPQHASSLTNLVSGGAPLGRSSSVVEHLERSLDHIA
jgi:hypothetical protein